MARCALSFSKLSVLRAAEAGTRVRGVAHRRGFPKGILLIFLIALSLRPADGQSRPAKSEAEANGALNQGQQIASAVSTVTGTAISPLFGVCLLGVYQYVRTPQSERAALPFYSRPIFWSTVGIILILVLLKDTIGGAAPLLKKPLDALEVLVLNKAALILIAFPVMIHEISRVTGVQLTDVFTALEPVAYAADFSGFGSATHIAAAAVSLVAGLVITCVMWMTGHVLDVLALLSPFPFLDLLLKGFRNTVVLALGVVTLLSPSVGLAASMVLILIGALVFSKALRLSIMGSCFAWDLLRVMVFGHRASPNMGNGVVGFSVGKVTGLPRHTLGRLTCGESGDLEFRYRVFGFGPHKRQCLDKAGAYQIGRGLLYPSVVVPYRNDIGYRLQFRLLPRYKGSEGDVCAVLKAGEVQDLLLQKGWRRFLNWASADIRTAGPAQ
jgi:hypothetical protein